MMESIVEDFLGEDTLTGVRVRNKKTNENTELNITGAFILIGYVPGSKPFSGVIELNGRDEIVTDEGMATNLKGVFAAGDIRQKKFRQITTAVSDGTIAALNAMEFMYGADPDKI